MAPSFSKKEVDKATGDITDYVTLEKLPEFQLLQKHVGAVSDASSWWELYGHDIALFLASLLGLGLSYFLMSSRDPAFFLLGFLLMGLTHAHITIKVGHNAVHGSMVQSPQLNRLICFFVSDFIGSFSADVGYDIHIRVHHPHTNIVGLGDSSTWKAPFLPNFIYMFLAPFLTPILVVLVSLQTVVSLSMFKTARYLLIGGLGFVFHLYLLTTVSQLGVFSSLMVAFLSRNLLSVPYIHVNIFQHIGLPMYSREHRPKRIYQMTTGVLNLPRNPILEYGFGSGIVNCHVEHHLFPRLSDNMCRKIKPVVEKFCREHELPYHYDTYLGRTKEFLFDYQNLMVNAPPVTKFVGLQ